MRSIRAFLCVFLVVFLFGCGLTEGVIQKDQKSYLLFTGNISNSIVYIDELSPVEISEDNGKTLYEISPGKHNIIVRKSGEVVVNRDILLGNGITKEISIP